ncbi:MAG: GNAT family N-acetyltransferase [Albidovulum sp.]
MKLVAIKAESDLWCGGPMPLQQSPAYGAVLARLGAEVDRVEITAPSGACARAQVVGRRIGPLRIRLMSRGPVWTAAPTAAEAEAALHALGRSFRPLIATSASATLGLRLFTPRYHALLDLSAAPDVLRSRLGQKWRNRLARAEDGGLRLSLSRPDADGIAWLMAEDAAQQKARGYRALPARFTHAWLDRDPAAALLAEARRGRERVAAMLFLLHFPWATYHVGWSGAAGRQADAHRLLLWLVMLHLREHGFSTLDLGDVNTEDAPGLARFKIGTGAQVVPLGSTVLLPFC